MQSLKNEFEMNGGHIIFNNNVIDVTINDDFIDTLVVDQVTKKKFLIKSHIAINCCGLGSVEIHKLAFPHDTKITSRYVKGDYYTYGGNEKIDNLIYLL